MFFKTAFNPNGALFPLLYLLGAWIVNYSFGLIAIDYPRHSINARDAGAAVVIPLLTALLWWGRLVSINFAVSALSYVSSHRRRRKSNKLAQTFERIISTNLNKFRLVAIIAASLIAVNYVYWEGLAAPFNHQLNAGKFRYILLIQALPFWFCVIYFFFTLIIVFQLSKIYLTQYFRVRLFEIEELSPLCNLVILNFLISFLAISTYTINGLYFDLPEVDIYLLLLSCLLLGFFLFSPIILVRRVIKERKEFMLGRINQSLNEQMLAGNHGEASRRLVDDEARLQFISDLLIIRKEINQAPLWPMSVPFTIKLILILMLPILSWMGAAFVSQMIKVFQL